MKKGLVLIVFAAICLIPKAKAQHKTDEDSTEVINAGRRYAASFRLRNKDLKKFHEVHFPFTSDYFKPDGRRIPKVLTNDSLFVKTYRATAYNRALDQQSFPGLHDFLPPNHLRPGENETVYTSPAQQAAQADAQKFSLDKALLTRFKTEHFPATSDYFKPSITTAASSAMLNDSSYVQTFRFEAYSRAYHQREHPAGHAFLIGGIIAAGIAIIVIISVALARTEIY